jgi:glycosyltransferase involved in cell wall biosynthesis
MCAAKDLRCDHQRQETPTMPRVSIIVPSYNTGRYLPVAINSVIAQTFPDWELIVIDDGSTDNTRAVAQSYAPTLGEKLRYLYQSNRGLPAARNAAIREARGEFIAILDADDLWLPTRLERGVAVMDSRPDVGLVHSRTARVDQHGTIVGYKVFPPKCQSGKIAAYLLTRRASISCPTVLFRKQCLDLVGPFDETMRATEDRDLWFRIAERYEVAYINEILAHSRITPGSMTSDPDRMLKWQLFFIQKQYQRGACTWFAVREALGQIYREQGDFLFSGGHTRKSISPYFRSVLYNPLRLKNVYMLLRACAEPFLIGLLPGRTSGVTEGQQR